MKYTLIAAALVASVAAQSLPTCALLCATNNAGVSGCSSVTDTACLCRSQAYLAAFASCLGQQCSASDQQAAATAGNQLCQAAGVTITNTPSPTGTASATGAITNTANLSSASSLASSLLSSASASASSAGNSSALASISSASRSLSSAVSSASANITASSGSATSRASSMASSMASSASAGASSATSRAAAPTNGLTWEFLGAAAAGLAVML